MGTTHGSTRNCGLLAGIVYRFPGLLICVIVMQFLHE